jgi:transposase-like protein
MEDFPRDLLEFEARFSTEAACREYLFRLRWPDGFCCPRCGGRKGWPKSGVLLQCSSCDYQSSVTAGTIFQDTRKPLTLWFRAAWWVTTQKNGASAMGLQRVLGLRSYKTAWTWLHKLRRAMVRPDRDRLTGRVEVDETYLGGLEEGVRGRQTEAKALIIVAAQEDGPGIGRIRMRRIADASAESLIPFVEESVEPGSVVHTDGWLGYLPLEGKGYDHEVTFLKGNKKTPSELMPRVHRVISLLKRWLMGTHQGAVSVEHLDYYLDEFTFRFNRRKSRSRGKLFFRLLQQAVAVDPVPYKSMVKCYAIAASPRPQDVGATGVK